MSAFNALKDHLVTAVTTSALLGGGAMVIGHNTDIARMDERITRIEQLDNKIEGLNDRLDRVTIQLTRVEAKQEK